MPHIGEMGQMGQGMALMATPMACRIWRNTNQSIGVGAAWVDLSWSSAAYQAGGTFWTSGASVIIPKAGYYQVFVEAAFDTGGLIGSPTCMMQVTADATVIGDDTKMLILGASVPLYVMAQRYFASGAVLKAQVKHGNSGALNVLTQGDHSPDIILNRLGGSF